MQSEPSISRISRDEALIEVARITAKRGTCRRASVGAVIALDGRIISSGYVGSPTGQPHCLDVDCWLDRVTGGCMRTVHAESNAIAFAARAGIATDGSTLYCTHSPCMNCAKLILNAGIIKLIYEERYRYTEGLRILEDTIQVIQWS